MRSVVRPVLGAALLLTGASAAMAQSGNPPVAYQSAQAGASTTALAAAPSSTPVAYQPVQAGVSTPIAASNDAAIAGQSPKPKSSGLCDRADAYGGHGPSTHWGTRAFWDGQSNAN